MKTNPTVQLLEIPMDQLSATCETLEFSLQMLYLIQQYRANPETMNTILIPVKRIHPPAHPSFRVPARRHYEVLGNYHIFFARKKAQCSLARCLCLNRPEEQYEIWQTELQSLSPGKPSITIMDQEELQQAFAYFTKKEKRQRVLTSLLSNRKFIQQLAKHPTRPYWSSWDPVKALAKSLKPSLSITKKHTDHLENYFHVNPQPLPRLCINTASAEALNRHLHIFLMDAAKAAELSHQLSRSPSRPYWRNAKDVAKALRTEAQYIIAQGKQTKAMVDKGLQFTPAPPPVPNTVPFLLEAMTMAQLRHEAAARGLTHKGMKKKALVDLLSP